MEPNDKEKKEKIHFDEQPEKENKNVEPFYFEIPEAESNLGNSTDVIQNPLENMEVKKEKSLELFIKLQKNMLEGKDINPFVIFVKDGVPMAEECIVNEDGTFSLPEVRQLSKKEIERKSKYVRRILDKITPVLHADIDNVTYIDLMRKDSEKLMKMMNALKTKDVKPRLQNRAGCIFLVVGDYEICL